MKQISTGVRALGGRSGETCFFRGQLELFLDDVGDDLRVRFGHEAVALGDEGVLEREVVFDDAVVHDDEGARAVAVGMGVFFGGAAVGGPAGVSDAVGAVDRVGDEHFGEVAELAGSAAELQPGGFATGDGYAGAVVATVFETRKAFHDDRHD